MAIMRMLPFARVPRNIGKAVMSAPFLFAVTLVTPFRRSVTFLKTRMLQRITLYATPPFFVAYEPRQTVPLLLTATKLPVGPVVSLWLKVAV